MKGRIDEEKQQAAFCHNSSCPVISDCLQYALDNDIIHGVWGGTTEEERRALRLSQTSTY